MAKACDICGEKTGFRNRFRCQDGVICKKCYQVVSNDFSRTIARSTVLELKKIYVDNADVFMSKEELLQRMKRQENK